MLKVLLFFTA